MILIKETMNEARKARSVLFGEAERKGNSDGRCLYVIMFPEPLEHEMRWF